MPRPRHYLLGPIRELADEPPTFVSAYGSPTTFHADVVWADDIADLELSRTRARFELGAEVFNDEHALLKRACHLWPNPKTKAALAQYEKNMLLADALNAAGVSPGDTCH
jgi:hypothetical protein